ncbi:MAG TPA: glycosyltransferase [Polyangiaceae bacterium]|jgi:sterol 3beta-glucosyltransferase|nr:glycosyltransferase [Polyangiaceae bacterium]
MKIALVTLGTRGDVQPYVAVARALMARGHDVKIAVSDDHAALLRSYGVAHHAMRGNFREMMQSDLGRAWLSSADSPLEYARLAKELFLPLQKQICEDADAAVEGADGVVFYVMAMHAMHAAERRGLPFVALAPWPMAASTEIAPLPAPWLASAPGFVRKLATEWIMRLGFSAFNGEHQRYRASIGMKPYRAGDTLHAVTRSGCSCVHLFSEAILPRPRDWQAHHHVAGFAFAPPLAYTPPKALAEFLATGPPPVYIGFGSMTGRGPGELAKLARRAARLAGVRAIIATGWAELDVESSKDVYVIDEAPHDWLFSRVAAVVHHGGAGTLAEGLRAGKPTVVAAFFADQPFWGWLNARIGAGPAPLLRKTLTPERLAAAIRAALDGAYTERARALAERIGAEDGAARAAALIEDAFR